MLDADKQSHCNGCEKHGDVCRFFPSLWDDNVLEYTYDQTIAGCPEEQAKNSEGECSRECFRCMELGWCVRGKHVSTAQIDHPRFARCQQCTCEGHVISEIAKTKKPWRQCRCEVRNDEFNFYESRIPYVAHHRTKIPQGVSIPEDNRIKFRVLDNIDDTMKSMEEAMEAQNDAVAALTRASVCGSKNVAPSNPNRRCANLRIQLSAVFSVGWGGSSKAITNFCDNMINAHAKIEVSTSANYLFVGSIDPRFKKENTENIIWDVVIGGSALEDKKKQNVITRKVPELLLSFRPPMIPLLIELYVVFEREAREPHFHPSFTHVSHSCHLHYSKYSSRITLSYHIRSLITMRLEYYEIRSNTGTIAVQCGSSQDES